MNMKQLKDAAEIIEQAWPEANPECGLILGSGWSEVADAFVQKGVLNYEDIPGLGSTGVVGHAGRLVWAEQAGIQTFIFQGRRHWYEGEGWTPIALPIYILKNAGVATTVLTNAAGGIRTDLVPGSLMLLDDHINMMAAHPLIGPHHEFWGTRFPDQSHLYNPGLRALMQRAATHENLELKHGVYLAASGPTYETPAEIRAYKSMGADAVGMSTVPEAVLANAAGMRVLGLSCITNCAAGILDQPLTHTEVTETTRQTMPKMKALLLQMWEEIANDLNSGR